MKDEAILLDILTHGQRALRAAKDKEQFLADEIAQSAVAYCISVMGEAVKRLPPDFQRLTPKFRGRTLRGCATCSFMRTIGLIGPLCGKRFGDRSLRL